MIDWKPAQARLGLVQDGNPGDMTFSALLRVIADPTAKSEVILGMARALKTFAVPLAALDTPRRLVGYISNTGNETGGFVTFEENLRYSAERMAQVWPNRYRGPDGKPNALANSLAFKPVEFAISTYGSRMGNRAGTRDGYDFRGLGPLQNTGRANAEACEKHTGFPYTTDPGLMLDPALGTVAALSWWSRSGCNAWLDKGNGKAARSLANAGRPDVENPEGWPRVSVYEAKLLKVLA